MSTFRSSPSSLAGQPFAPSARLLAQNKFFLDFCRLRLALAADERTRNWIVTPAEVGVQKERKVRLGDGSTVILTDHVHMDDSLHYDRRAGDLNLFVPADGTFGLYRQVVASDAPEWKIIHTLWLPLDVLNQVMPSTSADANHLSRDIVAGDPRI